MEWKDQDKKDETKTSQILLYKSYFSKIFNWDVDQIEVEFFIVKEKSGKKVNTPFLEFKNLSLHQEQENV